MRFIADFHIHSKYSRATSPDMNLTEIASWAKIKGIDLIGSGDFTHPLWLRELKNKLAPLGNGLFSLKAGLDNPAFILSAEVCNIFSFKGKTRKVHSIILAPDFDAVDRINAGLLKRGRLDYDGRPILGITLSELMEIILTADEKCAVIPAHAWTPHFAVFGSNSGFDSLEEAFGKYSKFIRAIETGLSSDPAMNWRLSKLDRVALISNSDAHSPRKLGREANVFACSMDYNSIMDAISQKDPAKFLYTIEFFPQEGKYHFDGHRKCRVCQRGVCPVCGRKLTVGVMHRIDDLADREEGVRPAGAIPYKSIIPLAEIIAEALDLGVATKQVEAEYHKIISNLGPEFKVLLEAPPEKIEQNAPERIAEAILKMRRGEVSISPGYDGEYGSVKIFGKDHLVESAGQLGLF